MDNSNQRLNDVFFYGLYMDEEILKAKNVEPRNRRIAFANDYQLRIGNMATLLRKKDSQAYGLVYSLTHDEVNVLYQKSGLTDYISESILVELEDGSKIATLSCILLNPPASDESNLEYFKKLKLCMESYDLPVPTTV
ncbi:gamma-glutamylcyclotransferase family protein [Sulfurospirillum arcachonense]|uniref:gamma-glutamylcyclotransferase family protein n=1 Tax=Sulfurospirillum arcachonense TaxID=57666 RepID=UPI000468DD11|nr:gamma-glutamylcyclotransferase family protein [Sulfurospirillum arcachonense]